MIDSVFVYMTDIYVGQLFHDIDKDTYSFKQENSGKLVNRAMNKLNLAYSSDAIKCALEERFVPPNRVNINQILYDLGLHTYDLWQIAKRTYGICVMDTIWFYPTKIDGKWFWEKHPLGREMVDGTAQKRFQVQLMSSPTYRSTVGEDAYQKIVNYGVGYSLKN